MDIYAIYANEGFVFYPTRLTGSKMGKESTKTGE